MHGVIMHHVRPVLFTIVFLPAVFAANPVSSPQGVEMVGKQQNTDHGRYGMQTS